MKQRFVFFFLAVVVLFFPTDTAAADFLFDYRVSYKVWASGKTQVKQDITLTNNVTNYYANNYSLTVFSERIDEVRARDPAGDISPVISKAAGQTTITLPFNVKNVGLDNQFTFTLEYVTPDVAEKRGQIWELIIPGIESTSDVRSYTVDIAVPPSFGKAAYISPPPGPDGIWSLAELGGGGISITYGNQQHYSFNLIYNLENLSNTAQVQEITLPPDTAYQKVVLNRLSELPQNVRLDRDGNWLAAYRLAAKEKKKILAEGAVVVFAEPDTSFKQTLTAPQVQLYTSPQPFWEQTDQIKTLGKQLATPKAIYDYVIEKLTYDYSRVELGIKRLGAATALANPQSAVCMEFSDLFIALARSAGIPAREVHGYAYTTNNRLQPLSLVSDVLHAWVEYYDATRGLWVPIDPTWGDTTRGIDYFNKLDLNHIAFAILGENSDTPYPAGSFKAAKGGKDVYIDFARDEVVIPVSTYQLSFADIGTQLLGRETKANLEIKNTGSVLFTPKKLQINSDFKTTYDSFALPKIPPFGKSQVFFQIESPLALNAQTITLSGEVDGSQIEQVVRFLPFYRYYFWPLVTSAVLGFGILLVYGCATEA